MGILLWRTKQRSCFVLRKKPLEFSVSPKNVTLGITLRKLNMAEVFEPEIAEVSETKIIVEVVDEYKVEKPV